MSAAPIPSNERQRLEALARYNILDTLPEAEYDDLTALAASICGAPISLVSFVDKRRAPIRFARTRWNAKAFSKCLTPLRTPIFKTTFLSPGRRKSAFTRARRSSRPTIFIWALCAF